MNNYKLIKSLGNGSYGNIYLVSDHNKKEHVIKKINLNKNEEKMNNSEILIGMFNNCPNLISYHDLFDSNNSLYLVMSYYPQGTLKNYLQITKPNDKTKNFIVSNIISGVQYLHNNKVIHRDLKSDNILIKDNIPVICDFGTCRILDKYEYFAKTSIGTPYYLSPEIASGNNHTYQADIYSLGCILCEIYKNKLPYSGVNLGNLFYNVSKNKMNIALNVSNITDYLIKHTLNNDPTKRPSINQIQNFFDTKIYFEDYVCYRKDKVFRQKIDSYQKITKIKDLIFKIKNVNKLPLLKNASVYPKI